MLPSLRDQLTPREGAGRLPALLLDQDQPPGQLPVTGQGYIPPMKRLCCCWERGCIISLFRRHPLISFFVLAYALSWWPSILYALDLSSQPIVGFGPFLAALVVLAFTRGKTGMGGLLRRMVRWRVGLRWYAVALLLPVGLTAVGAALNVFLLGARTPSSAELGGWSNLFVLFAILLLVPGLGGTWEEPGWRGYALPRLQTGHSALSASLILGVLWAFWHLPLMLVGEVRYSDIVFVI